TKARAVVSDRTALLALRSFAVELLAFDDSGDATQLLMGQLSAKQPLDLQRSAVRALVQPGRMRDLPVLVAAEQWNSYTPGVRAMLVDRLAGNPELVGILLGALESGQIPM